MDNNNRVEKQLRDFQASRVIPPFLSLSYREDWLRHLEKVKLAFKDTNDPSEFQSLKQVDKEISRLIGHFRNDLDQRLGRSIDNLMGWLSEKFNRALRVSPHLSLKQTIADWAPEGLSRWDRQFKMRVIDTVASNLRLLGMPGMVDEAAAVRILHGDPSIQIAHQVTINGQQANMEAQFERAPGSGRYFWTGYDLSLFRGLTPDRDTIEGINVKDLQIRMEAVPWQKDFTRGPASVLTNPADNVKILQNVREILTDLTALLASGDQAGKKIHDQLVVQHFLNTPNASLVKDMDEIKRPFEYKIHVDLSIGSSYDLSPVEALQLLNKGSILVPVDNRGQAQQWINAREQQNGYYQIKPVAGSENFHLNRALADAKVTGFPEFQNHHEAFRALYRGETVKAALLQNGQHVQRFMYADPIQKRMAVDWIRTEREGLFKRDELMVEKLEQYVGRQNGTYVAPVVVQSPDTAPVEKAAVQQPSFWNIEEGRKVEINDSNLASLEKQMKEMGVREGVAKEVLEMAAKNEDPRLLIPYKQEYGEDTALAELRFRKDPDTDWVHFAGYDMKATLGDTHKAVNQRYYYNPEDPVNNYSLEEAYRMAKGNGVSRMVGIGDQTREVWRTLGLDRELSPKGNHLIISTPFDLEKAMLEYPHRNELIKYLAPGHSIDSILSRARKGEDVHFSISKNDILEVMNLRLDLKESSISVVRSAGSPKEGASQQQSVGNKKTQGQGAAEGELSQSRRTTAV
jgi:hypothetical protein